MSLDISNIPIIDTHEHIIDEDFRIKGEKDPFSLFLDTYLRSDLLCAGVQSSEVSQLRNQAVPLEERWKVLEPYWNKVSNTAYAREIRLAISDIYHVSHLDSAGIHTLAEEMKQKITPGFYQSVFDKAKISYALVQDAPWIYQPNQYYYPPQTRPIQPSNYFKKVLRCDAFVIIVDKGAIPFYQDFYGFSPIHSLTDYLDLIEWVIEKEEDIVALKLAVAYHSHLDITKPSFHEAETVFNKYLSGTFPFMALNGLESKPLRDFIIHHLVKISIKKHLPIQIHTGYVQSADYDIRSAEPLQLIPLLSEYRDARFVLFHGGYPWTDAFAALGKAYPNVWLDLCWLWSINPYKSRDLLENLIEAVPQNKVTAFGGDYLYIEGSYASSVLARQYIRAVLEKKVQEGWFTEEKAFAYAQAVLHDNACELYNLGN